MSSHHNARFRRARSPFGGRRPGLLLAAAAAGGVLVSTLATTGPAASADAAPVAESVSVAQALGVDEVAPAGAGSAELSALGDLAASRSERGAAAVTAAQAQQAADQAERDRLAAEAAAAEAAARAAAEAQAAAEAAQAQAAAEAQAAQAAQAPAAPATPASSAGGSQGSFKDYALAQVGNASQFSCLESLWGRESGWNPDAQNPTSTAYGIPQFLNSTWAGTGIPKTSDGYRQIDAGLIYINNRYGSPCGAWAHSQSTGWY